MRLSRRDRKRRIFYAIDVYKRQDFNGIFDWLSESMSCISQSQVGDQVSFGNLPDDARKAKEDRAIDEGWY